MNIGILTKEEVSEFQGLVKKVYRTDLSEAQAEEQGARMVLLLELFKGFEPIPLSYKDVVEFKSYKNKNAIK